MFKFAAALIIIATPLLSVESDPTLNDYSTDPYSNNYDDSYNYFYFPESYNTNSVEERGSYYERGNGYNYREKNG